MPKRKTIYEKIDELARAVKRGFDETATKQDFTALAADTKRELAALATKEQLQLVVDNLDLARADIHDIKLTLGPLVRHAAAYG